MIATRLLLSTQSAGPNSIFALRVSTLCDRARSLPRCWSGLGLISFKDHDCADATDERSDWNEDQHEKHDEHSIPGIRIPRHS